MLLLTKKRLQREMKLKMKEKIVKFLTIVNAYKKMNIFSHERTLIRGSLLTSSLVMTIYERKKCHNW